jgi:hypothetical protein
MPCNGCGVVMEFGQTACIQTPYSRLLAGSGAVYEAFVFSLKYFIYFFSQQTKNIPP